MLARFLSRRLPAATASRRLVVLTGARQVGKTTLARGLYGGGLRYLNFDSAGERERANAVPAEGWGRAVGPAILDEVQKAPAVFDKVKWAYDEGQIGFSLLLGSSRILLLDQVRESLAGRTFLYELWPLTAGELAPFFGGAAPEHPLIERLADQPDQAGGILRPLEDGVVGPLAGAAQAAVGHLLDWGGMPPLLQYPPEDRLAWLDSYQATYLERDLADLAQLRNLDAFALCHRLAALRAGQILSYSELARDAALPVSTVRRYLRYLELSYQTFPLPAWSDNAGSRLVKAPKLIWIDAGIQRILAGQTAGLRGEQYESALVAQSLTTLWSLGARFRPSYLRTAGGLEVDLILETEAGLLAVEIKARPAVTRHDATPIEKARRFFGERFRAGIVLYRGQRVERLGEATWAVPDWLWLAG
jgi:predicted AAA+ superfamily ATPase